MAEGSIFGNLVLVGVGVSAKGRFSLPCTVEVGSETENVVAVIVAVDTVVGVNVNV